MGLEPLDDEQQKSNLKAAFLRFKQKNNSIANAKAMAPDSLLIR